MTFQPSLQSFDVSSAWTIMSAPDWDNDRIFVQGHPSAFHMSRFGILSGNLEVEADLAGSVFPNPTYGIDQNGYVYMADSSQNFTSFRRYTADLAEGGTWGTNSAGWNIPNGLPLPTTAWQGIKVGSQTIMLTASNTLTANPDPPHQTGYPVNSQLAVPFAIGAPLPLWFGDKNPYICKGAEGASSSDAYVITGPTLPGDSQHIVIYKLGAIDSSGTIDATLVATLPAATIDATWTHCFHTGLVFDATDGNLIAKVWTSDAVTNTAYILKVNVSDGSILWRVAVASVGTGAQQTTMGQITKGVYAHFTTGPNTVTTIQTGLGTSSTYTTGLAGLVGGSAQCYNDTLGAILMLCDFTQTSGSPLLRGSTPSSFSSQWALLYVADVTPPPGGRTGYTRIWGNW